MAQLPQELVDRIIDYVAGHTWKWKNIAIKDKITYRNILSCALTCRAWLHRSKYHLEVRGNEKIVFNGMRDFQSLAQVLRNPESGLQFFSRCRAMVLILYKDLLGVNAKQWIHAMPLILGKQRLSTINALHIGFLDWERYTPHPTFFSLGLPMFVNVTELELFDCVFRSFYQFQNLVGALPALMDLTVECCTSYTIPPPSLLSRKIAPSQLLSQIFWGVCDDELDYADADDERKFVEFGTALAIWLLSSFPSAHLHMNCASLWYHDEMQVNMTRIAGSTLRTIWILLDYETIWDLSAFVNLHTIMIVHRPQESFGNTLCESFPNMFRTLPEGSNLQRVDVLINDYPWHDFPRPSKSELQRWRNVTDVLNKFRAPSLRDVTLTMYDLKYCSEDSERIPEWSVALDVLEEASTPLLRRGVRVHLKCGDGDEMDHRRSLNPWTSSRDDE